MSHMLQKIEALPKTDLGPLPPARRSLKSRRARSSYSGWRTASQATPDYHEALQEFVKAAREHIRYEQEVVWPAFETVVGLEDRKKLGAKLEAAKKIAPTRPHPDTPSNSMVQKTMGTGAAIVSVDVR